MDKIRPKRVLFIKLGRGGSWEKECIHEKQTLRLGYSEIDHQKCVAGEWSYVHKYYIDNGANESVATSHENQIRQFYEEDENTLWLTFFANKMWWCFSYPTITLLSDGTKTRPVIGKWSDKDIQGHQLRADNISGKLLKTQGFRGTICSVPEDKYAIAKINHDEMREVAEVEKAVNQLKEKLSVLIEKLQWKDFEILIDLIFRQAGWQRVGVTGKTAKTLDLDLIAPVTGETAVVQIKSQSDLKEFEHYEREFAKMSNYSKFFYVVHSPKKDLLNYENETETNLMFLDKITELSIASGLVDWIIKKTS